jgi:hypothetical protein
VPFSQSHGMRTTIDRPALHISEVNEPRSEKLSVTSAANRCATPDHGCAPIADGATTNDGGAAIANGSARSNATGTVRAARRPWSRGKAPALGSCTFSLARAVALLRGIPVEAQHDDDALHVAPFHVLIFFTASCRGSTTIATCEPKSRKSAWGLR